MLEHARDMLLRGALHSLVEVGTFYIQGKNIINMQHEQEQNPKQPETTRPTTFN